MCVVGICWALSFSLILETTLISFWDEPLSTSSIQELSVGLQVGASHFSLCHPTITLVQGWPCDPKTAKEHMEHLLGLLGERNVLFLTELEPGVHLAMQMSCHQKFESDNQTNIEDARLRDDIRC